MSDLLIVPEKKCEENLQMTYSFSAYHLITPNHKHVNKQKGNFTVSIKYNRVS